MINFQTSGPKTNRQLMPRLTNKAQSKQKKYVLIGIPNSGKSTIGRLVAKKLQIPFYNTDKLAYERLKFDDPAMLLMPSGMMRLVEEKSKLLTEFAKLEDSAIIEIWPESVLRPSDVKVIKKIGTIIYIKRDTKLSIAGLKKSNTEMIFINKNTGEKMSAHAGAINLYSKESHHFEALADLTLENNGSLNEAVKKLVAIINGQPPPQPAAKPRRR